MFLNSWKTSTAGVVALLVAVGSLINLVNSFLEGQPITFEQISVAVVAVTVAATGIFARDNNVTSEEAGAE